MKFTAKLYLLMCALIPLSAYAHIPQNYDEYSRHIYVDSTGNSMPYRMLVPEEIQEGETYPLVLFLHGSGERGDDNEKQLTYGASIFSNPANADKYPAFVIFPQCKDKAWTERNEQQTFMPGADVPPESSTEKTLMALLEDIIENNPIDRNRIYVVGISMGGIAAYDLVCRYPDTFTAAVPICGAVNPDRLSDAREVRFLIFHGDEDEEIPSICGREAYRALNAAGAEVDYIEFAGIGHECWSSAFNYPALLPWLFSQSRHSINNAADTDITYNDN